MKSSVSRPERMRSALTRVGADAVGAVIDRVLAHQQQGRGLGQAVGAEVRPRVDRLLGDVEQQAAAGALRQHDLHRGLRDALVAEEIQLEALAQDRFVDFADAALPRRAGVGDDDVDAAERLRRPGRRPRRTDGRVGDVAGDGERVRPMASACLSAAVEIDIEQRDLGAGRGESPGGGGADGAAGAGDRQRPGRRAAALSRVPSLACSSGQYSTSNMSASVIDWKRPIASASVMAAIAASARSAAMRGVLRASGRGRRGRAPAPARCAAADRASS